LKTTSRGVIDVLAASQELRESIGLKRLPHYSTLKRFGDRSSFQTRSGRKNSKYVKLSLAILCGSLLPCGLVVSWGQKTDRAEAPEILEKAMAKVRPKKLYADDDYDAEWLHAVCRDHWNVENFILPSMHRNEGSVGRHDRLQMVELPKSSGLRCTSIHL
jgi:hypothetical protein